LAGSVGLIEKCASWQATFIINYDKMLYHKTSTKHPRLLLEHWPWAFCIYYCYLLSVYVNFTLCVNSQRLYLLG